MQLSSKIALSFIMVVVLTTGILLGIIAFAKQNLQQALSMELREQMQLRTAEVLQPIYKLCAIKEAQTIPLLQKDLDNASYLLARMGGLSLGEDTVPWKVINAREERIIELPMILAGGIWLGQVLDKATPSPIVDDIRDLSSVHCTIYQRVNRQGDMLAVGTSEQTPDSGRAVGTYVGHLNPDGSRNLMINDILEARPHQERASYANGWISLICEPLLDGTTGEVIGSLCVSHSQWDTVEALRKVFLETAIGTSGYTWVLGTKKERRGVYIISKDGARDGESLWGFQDGNGQYFVRSIVQQALQGKEGDIQFYRYAWMNPGDPQPRMKISAFTYFEPWDWIIGISAYEDDFQDSRIRAVTTLNNMQYLTMSAGLALIACSMLVGYVVRRTITGFTAEREEQNWLKTNLNLLSEKIRGEQDVYPLAQAILGQLKTSLGAHIGVIYQRQEPDLLFPLATCGLTELDENLPPIPVGEGVVGQTALDKQTLFLREVPETYVTISTGFGKVLPRNMIITPLVHEEEVIGAVQLGSMLPISDIQRSFVEDAAEAIAIALYTAQSRAQVDELLAHTQQQALDLERISGYKSDFMARMSHEIRTPINAVMGLASIVLKSGLTAEQRDYLGKIRIASNNLLQVVNDILDFSKVEAGKLEVEHIPFHLDEVMENLSDMFSDRVKDKDLELVFIMEPDVPRQLTGDPGRLSQVLTNLIDNAIKFTNSGEIVVHGGVAAPAEDQVEQTNLQFQVRDTGIGMAPDSISTLFEPFTQADSYLTRGSEGAGLGLTICRRLVEMMGGTIWADSAPGKGSTFTFTVSLEPGQKESRSAPLPGDLQGAKILVADHNQWSRKMLNHVLGSFGFTTTGVADGEAAVEQLRLAAEDGKPYRLLLLDWKIPDIDCSELVNNIVSDPLLATAGIPLIIIMTTSYNMATVKEKMDTAPAGKYLVKPIKPSQLYNCIMEVLGRTEAILPGKPLNQALEGLDALQGRRILLVEDNAFNRDVAAALLQNAGMQVEIAENGQQAVNKVKQSTRGYDAVLMDIQMPVMDGYAATRQIRKLDQLGDGNRGPKSATPVIALTAHALTGQREQCLATGMDDYIAKPFNEEQLLQVLLRWTKDRKRLAKPSTSLSTCLDNLQDDFPSGLDVRAALERLGGKKDLYSRIVQKFVREFADADMLIDRCLASGEMATARRIAHTVKSAAGIIGANVLADAAHDLERTLANQVPETDAPLKRFRKELIAVLDNIAENNGSKAEEPKGKAPSPSFDPGGKTKT